MDNGAIWFKIVREFPNKIIEFKMKNEDQNPISIFLIFEYFKLISFGRVDLVTQ